MRDYLIDIVKHTLPMNAFTQLRIDNEDDGTAISATETEKKMVLRAKTHVGIPEFKQTFGVPNLSLMNTLLNIPVYDENSTIRLDTKSDDAGNTIPFNIHFENDAGDFKNDFRLMSQKEIESVEPKLTFNADLPVQFVPTLNAMQRFKYQVSAHPDEKNVEFNIENGVVRCTVGDASSHSGTFMFHNEGIDEKSRYTFSVPSAYVLAALNMDGDKSIKMGSLGVMITVDSGLISYDYIIPMVSK